MAFDSIYGLPDVRLDQSFARLSALTANVWRGKKDKAATAEDFMPKPLFEQFDTEVMTEDERIAAGEDFIRMFTKAFGLKPDRPRTH